MKPFIFVNFNNGAKFRKCTCWLTNETQSHCILCWVNSHHIGNEELVLLGHVEIGL